MFLHLPKEEWDARVARSKACTKNYKGRVLVREVADTGPLGAPLHYDKTVHWCQTFWKPSFGSECAAEKAVGEAALAGYNVPEDGGNESKVEQEVVEEEAVLQGDSHKLSVNQKRVLLLLKESQHYPRFKLKQISLSFSGASVFFFSPSRKDGTPLP